MSKTPVKQAPVRDHFGILDLVEVHDDCRNAHGPRTSSPALPATARRDSSRTACLPLRINFETSCLALAPAACRLSKSPSSSISDLDWSTFQLGDFSFGGQLYAVRAGLKSYQTCALMTPGTTGVYVDVDASFDEQTGAVTWTFTSIDPTTLDVPAGNPERVSCPRTALRCGAKVSSRISCARSTAAPRTPDSTPRPQSRSRPACPIRVPWTRCRS